MANITSSADVQVGSIDKVHNQKKSGVKKFTERRVIFVLIIFILMLFAIVLSFILRQFASVLDGIVISLLTSLIFTGCYLFVVEDDMRDAQNEEQEGETQKLVTAVNDRINRTLNSVLKSVMSSLVDHLSPDVLSDWNNLLPVKSFPPSDEPLDGFANRVLDNMTMSSCTSYKFRGGTGRRCATWLEKRNDSALDCRILILDPGDDTAIAVHAQDRNRADSDGKSGSLDDVKREIREEIAEAISALYALKKPFRIHVRTCTDKLFCRAEIFDEEAIVSFLTTDRTKYHPAAHVYAKKSSFYNTIWKDFFQSWDNYSHEFVISPTSTNAERDKTLKALGLLV